jgi:hypothetical protein
MVKNNFSHAKNLACIAFLLSVSVNAAEVKTLADLDVLQG